MNEDRFYSRREGVKNVLVSWRQRRCQICQRFLGKLQRKFCSRCRPIEDRKRRINYYRIRRIK
jgi:hypothetical protein